MSDNEQDRYGRSHGWTYRVFSTMWTYPDDAEAGRRYLTLRRVYWNGPPVDFAIEHEEATPEGHTIAQVEVELKRMRQALDKPALILVESVSCREAYPPLKTQGGDDRLVGADDRKS